MSPSIEPFCNCVFCFHRGNLLFIGRLSRPSARIFSDDAPVPNGE